MKIHPQLLDPDQYASARILARLEQAEFPADSASTYLVPAAAIADSTFERGNVAAVVSGLGRTPVRTQLELIAKHTACPIGGVVADFHLDELSPPLYNAVFPAGPPEWICVPPIGLAPERERSGTPDADLFIVDPHSQSVPKGAVLDAFCESMGLAKMNRCEISTLAELEQAFSTRPPVKTCFLSTENPVLADATSILCSQLGVGFAQLPPYVLSPLRGANRYRSSDAPSARSSLRTFHQQLAELQDAKIDHSPVSYPELGRLVEILRDWLIHNPRRKPAPKAAPSGQQSAKAKIYRPFRPYQTHNDWALRWLNHPVCDSSASGEPLPPQFRLRADTEREKQASRLLAECVNRSSGQRRWVERLKYAFTETDAVWNEWLESTCRHLRDPSSPIAKTIASRCNFLFTTLFEPEPLQICWLPEYRERHQPLLRGCLRLARTLEETQPLQIAQFASGLRLRAYCGKSREALELLESADPSFPLGFRLGASYLFDFYFCGNDAGAVQKLEDLVDQIDQIDHPYLLPTLLGALLFGTQGSVIAIQERILALPDFPDWRQTPPIYRLCWSAILEIEDPIKSVRSSGIEALIRQRLSHRQAIDSRLEQRFQESIAISQNNPLHPRPQ